MITVNYAGNAFSQDFIDAINAQMVEYDAKLYDNGSPVDCSIMRMTLTLGGCSEADEGFQIGEVYASSLTATLHGLASSLTGHELDVVVGVNTGSAYEYAQVATVVVTSSKAKGGFTAIQAAGKLAYACTNVPIGTSGELTPSEVAAAVLAASGIPVTIGQFASTTTVTITEDMTCRQALAATAKRLGGYACETNAGGAAVMPFSSTPTYTLDPEDMTRYPDLEESDYTVDGITVRAEDAEYAYGTGRVVIEDAYATATTSAVTWANVSGYAFRQGSANTAILDPRVTPFDVLTIGTATMPARGISATYDGGYFGVFSALGLTDEGEAAHFKGAIAEQVDRAEQAAREALEVAEATDQHFWDDTSGAHVTEITQDDWLAEAAKPNPFADVSDSKPYHNILMNSLGILLRSALNNLVSITRSAIAFFDGDGNNAGNVIASFGTGGAQLGKSGSNHFAMDASSLTAYDSSGTKYFEVTANGLTFGPNTAATTAQVTEAVDAIQVGGTNLLLDSGSMASWWKDSRVTISDGVATMQGSSSAWTACFGNVKFDASLFDGKTTYVYAFDYKSTAACVVLCVIAGSSAAAGTAGAARTKYAIWQAALTLPSTGGEWTRFSLNPRTIAVSQLTSGSGDVVSGFIQVYARTDTTIYVRHVKLETGNKPTDWTPAPEDVDAAVDGAAKTATNYIYADSSGIRIANADPATQNQRLHMTSSAATFYDANGKKRTQVDSSGLQVFSTDGSTQVGKFADAVELGKSASATGTASVAIGQGTKAASSNQMALGKFNVADGAAKYALIVGNGTGDSARSNIMAVQANGYMELWHPNLTVGSNPSSNTYDGVISWNDKNGTLMGQIQETFYTDGRMASEFKAERTVNGNRIYHGFDLIIAANGTRSVYLSEAAPWLAALGLKNSSTTSTASNIVSAASGVTIVSAAYGYFGKVATVNIAMKRSSAIGSGNIENITLGTIASGKRPAIVSPFTTTGSGPVFTGYINQSGNIVMSATSGTIAANAEFSFAATYILA